MNPAICTAVNRIANVSVDAETGAAVASAQHQVIVQLVSVNTGVRTDFTISNPPAEFDFEVGKAYGVAFVATDGAQPPTAP